MRQVLHVARLPLLLILALILGHIIQKPGQLKMEFPGGSVIVPRTVEGWSLQPGDGQMLVTGRTLLNTISLEIEKTGIPRTEDVQPYVAERHTNARRVKENYHVRLNGQMVRYWGKVGHGARGVYDDRFLGLPWIGQYVQHDMYFPHEGEWLRVGMRFPLSIEKYVEMDQFMIMAGLKLAQ